MKFVFKVLIFATLLLACSKVFSQGNPDVRTNKVSALELEILGNGIFYSINYHRLFFQMPKLKGAIRAGVANGPERFFKSPRITFPAEVTLLYGKFPHLFEFGPGITPLMDPLISENNELESYHLTSIFHFRFGYRYQQKNGGLFIRAGIVPGLYPSMQNPTSPDIKYERDEPAIWGGAGIGFSF